MGLLSSPVPTVERSLRWSAQIVLTSGGVASISHQHFSAAWSISSWCGRNTTRRSTCCMPPRSSMARTLPQSPHLMTPVRKHLEVWEGGCSLKEGTLEDCKSWKSRGEECRYCGSHPMGPIPRPRTLGSVSGRQQCSRGPFLLWMNSRTPRCMRSRRIGSYMDM